MSLVVIRMLYPPDLSGLYESGCEPNATPTSRFRTLMSLVVILMLYPLDLSGLYESGCDPNAIPT